jgi:hypothetical protein
MYAVGHNVNTRKQLGKQWRDAHTCGLGAVVDSPHEGRWAADCPGRGAHRMELLDEVLDDVLRGAREDAATSTADDRRSRWSALPKAKQALIRGLASGTGHLAGVAEHAGTVPGLTLAPERDAHDRHGQNPARARPSAAPRRAEAAAAAGLRGVTTRGGKGTTTPSRRWCRHVQVRPAPVRPACRTSSLVKKAGRVRPGRELPVDEPTAHNNTPRSTCAWSRAAGSRCTATDSALSTAAEN